MRAPVKILVEKFYTQCNPIIFSVPYVAIRCDLVIETGIHIELQKRNSMTWAILLCRFRDLPQETRPAGFFQSYFTRAGIGTEGAFDYWNDLSNGQFVNDSEVFGWFEIPHDSTEIQNLHRSAYQQWGFDAAEANGLDLRRFSRTILFFNANGDHGAVGGGTTVFAYAFGRALEPTFIFHEMGHTLGLGHSFSDSTSGCCGSSLAGEYCNGWDIMSAMCVFQFAGLHGTTGPGLNAPTLNQLGWLTDARIATTATIGVTTHDVELIAVNHPEIPGKLVARIDFVDRLQGLLLPFSTYFVELRTQDRWDRGLPNAAVLIHRKQNGRTVLVGSGRANRPNLEWRAGDRFDDFGNHIAISVLSVDPVGKRAMVRLQVAGLNPVWMVPSPIPGIGMRWLRAADEFVAADIDGDGRKEFLVANNQNGWIGVIKWNASGLAPTWMVTGRIQGTGMHWSRGIDTFHAADIDGDGRDEIVIANNQNGWIGVLKWIGSALAPVWMVTGRIQGNGMHWSRGSDLFYVADVDGDGLDEIVIVNNQNGWIGVLKWNGAALAPVWMVTGRIQGNGMHWSRGQDIFHVADVDGDGRDEILIANNQNGWIGVLKWNGTALSPVWMITGRVQGPGGHWSRGLDQLVPADLDGDGRDEIVISNIQSGWIGVLKWNGSALIAQWVTHCSNVRGFQWFAGATALVGADMDGDGSVEIFVGHNPIGWTALLKWDGTALQALEFSPSPLNGSAGRWRRGPDFFVPADLDGDKRMEMLVANNQNGWTGVLKWEQPA